MERLDFASIMAVLRRYLDEDLCSNQQDLIYVLFEDFLNDNEDFDFDNSQVCKWFNGQARISPRISSHYHDPGHKAQLRETLEKKIFPMLIDRTMAVQELRDLLIQDPSVSEDKKQDLLLQKLEQVFVCEELCYAMFRRFQRRDPKLRCRMESGSLSPILRDLVFDEGIPRPCRWFQGRTRELEELHRLMAEKNKVFLWGIPGIGKSEFGKMYAQNYGKWYTNVLYLNSSGDLSRDIRNLDFADDRPEDSDDDRLKKHNRLLKSMKEDTLLIVDNYNTPMGQDDFLDTVLAYRCSILFITRCRYEDRDGLELGELEPEELLALMHSFVSYPERRDALLREIIDTLHRHTFATELAARSAGPVSELRHASAGARKARTGLSDYGAGRENRPAVEL